VTALPAIRVRVLAFARVRELLGWERQSFELRSGARTGDLWEALVASQPRLADLARVVRLAVNGALTDNAHPLQAGDEVAVLPPVSGG